MGASPPFGTRVVPIRNRGRPAGYVAVLATALGAIALLAPAFGGTPRDEYRSVLAMTPDRIHGQTLFGNCVRCHRANGNGSADGTIPAIAGQHIRVLARELVDFRHDKRWDARMEHFADTPYVMTTQDVADIVAYVNSLPVTGPAVTGDGEQVQHGAEQYARRCAACHGPQAEGNPIKGYPRLAAQHYPYLLRQLHDAVEGRRPNFPASHVRLMSPLNRDDFVGISDFLSRLPPDASRALSAVGRGKRPLGSVATPVRSQ